MALDRRAFFGFAGSLFVSMQIPRVTSAAGRDPRFVVVILRGALDGLAAVPPIGNLDYQRLRGSFAIGPATGSEVLSLDGFFGLNPAMPKMAARYAAKEALVVHAVATPYRERSHFDGQDVLESGIRKGAKTGWLNRVIMATSADVRAASARGLAVSSVPPLIIRGEAPVMTWTPPDLRPAVTDTVSRVMDLYAATDPELARAFAVGAKLEEMVRDQQAPAKRGAGAEAAFIRVATGAARLLARDDGPRVAVLNYDGWDTHAFEGAHNGHLARLLAALDAALDALSTGLSSVWRDTVVIVLTEFGRTVKINGTSGTDHGTATTAFALGGAIRGGRVVADWPGLGVGKLHDDRDLAPTTDLRAVLKGLLCDHLGISDAALGSEIFPDSGNVPPMRGLIT